MVPMLAVQSVEKKMQIKASIILGNYEFYYAAGKLARNCQVEATKETEPLVLKEKLEMALEGYSPQNEEEAYLITIVKRYRPTEAFDEQMSLLFQWGYEGEEPV